LCLALQVCYFIVVVLLVIVVWMVFMELALLLQENLCRWFPTKVAILWYLYSPSTSKVGILCVRVLPSASHQLSNSLTRAPLLLLLLLLLRFSYETFARKRFDALNSNTRISYEARRIFSRCLPRLATLRSESLMNSDEQYGGCGGESRVSTSGRRAACSRSRNMWARIVIKAGM